MATVSIRDLSKIYAGGSEPAVKSVSLDVADGEFMVLLGPSGCGKSSVLRMIAGLEPISSGTLAIDGQMMNDVPAKNRDIAMVFQSYALYPHMDVYDNMAFGLKRRGKAKDDIDRRVREAAAKLGLTDYLKRKPHALSGGQRQRVALGRAIVRDPKVFLFDEPLSNLDAALRVSTRNELIKQQAELGTTAIYVTHDQMEAMTMGHRICIMNRGRVVQLGKPLDVYRDPADMFVARFLGNPPMNVLTARLELSGAEPAAMLGGLSIPLRGWTAALLADWRDKPVCFGIRPEDIYEWRADETKPGLMKVETRVAAVEPLGAETLVILALEGSGEEVIARIGRDTSLARGDHAAFALDLTQAHLFDAQTGAAIRRNPGR